MELINSLPVDLLTDFVYVLMTENMDNEAKEEFDGKLAAADSSDADRSKQDRIELAKKVGALA